MSSSCLEETHQYSRWKDKTKERFLQTLFACIIVMLKNRRQSSGISGRDRIVVSTSRCGRDNPGSNPGHGMPALLSFWFQLFIAYKLKLTFCNIPPCSVFSVQTVAVHLIVESDSFLPRWQTTACRVSSSASISHISCRTTNQSIELMLCF